MIKKRFISMLVLLAAVATGAMAQEPGLPVVNGKFSVSDTKQVYFSKGNLRYASGAWSFFDNQYDYYTSYSANAWDKFGWSTSATTYGKNTSTDANTYSGNFVDWGETMGTGWFTLSNDEWKYLFNTRTINFSTGSGKSYTVGQKVNNKPGVVIYPDNYTGEVYTTGANWSTFEAAGCVFLPIANLRDGTKFLDSTRGCYWSSTSFDADEAYYENITNTAVQPNIYSYRKWGLSVRLVHYDEVTLTDGQAITALNTHAGKEIWVSYTRSFTEGTASTVCLPFAYNRKADEKFYTFTGITKSSSEYVADMTEEAGATLTANTPYLFMPSATGDVDFGGAYTIPATLTAGSTTSNGWTFKGTYETIEWTTAPTGTYGFSAQDANDGISQGQFVKVGAYVKIAPMRCYLENASFAGARSENGTNDEVLPETIKVRLISANGTVTAIGSLSTKTGEVTLDNDDWYSLDGRRIQNPTKGVYIKNGRKVIK